ncbi:hypothetical protein E2C01_037794 [Portunus trituberculatus]|uniref:Endonuclease/exonuclease/phosphatase domain-containing protein n=1 Tax=Portunus trituberculatus TaxID=210409 RepID=A0A5B7F921_PORTR|nr:hypothetical protein [Portunus trituberculatus]
MATPNPASESFSGEGTRNVPRSDSSRDDDPKCHDTSLNIFYINFCNIRGLRSNLQFVQHHLSSVKSGFLFLTETQLSEATDSSLFSVPSYFLYSHFLSKAGCCVYVRSNVLTCSRAHALASSEFSTIWLSRNDLWQLAKNISNNFTSLSFPPLFHPDGTTAISSVSNAELLCQTFAINSTLDVSGLVTPSPPPSDYFMSSI